MVEWSTTMNDQPQDNRPDAATVAVHADSGYGDELGVAPAIDMSVTFTRSSQALFHELAGTPRPVKFYGRYGNPTVDRVAKLVSGLAGSEATLLTSSGMAAIFTTIFALTSAGDHLVVGTECYGETLELLSELERFGIEVTYLDKMSPSAVDEAITARTKLVYVETPSNPLMTVTDLAGVAQVCRHRGIVSVADNTVASCVNSRPISAGIDLVVESGTKFMGGHSDVIAGAVSGRLELLERVWWPQVLVGCVLGPLDAWILQRGIRTIALRVRQQNATALALAERLAAHPRVERVFYPGLATHPGHEVAARQMSGYGGLLSFEAKGGFAEAAAFVSRLKLCTYAASLGDVHTLVMHPAAGWRGREYVPREASFVPENLLRVSVGIEDANDVIQDVLQALN
jgi:methionine-gamma-lyase